VKVRIAFALILALCIAALSPARAQTKDQKRAEAQLRTVHGSVLDKAENPVPSSVVYLKNLKTQAVKTYIADDTGHYRFSGLDPNVDYEIHAEHDDVTSSTRTISSFDTRRDMELTLKLTRKRPPN
jgi:protocatechuate 3,4-dioxygenase beta subunit